MNVEFRLIEVGGLIASIEGMRFPTKSKGDSLVVNEAYREPFDSKIILGPKDIDLASKLLKQGPVHGKFQRGIKAWFHINMPRSIWSELDTYSVGVDMISSESTMYTLVKECKNITKDMFVSYTPDFAIEQFRQNVAKLTEEYGSRNEIPIHILKSILPEGWLQARNRGFSYQCLASMYHYRKDHRMPEWREVICKSIEKLPYFKELILEGYNE
jgi:hypothetical protein